MVLLLMRMFYVLGLSAEAKLFDNFPIPLFIVSPKIVEQSSAPADQFEKTHTRMMVLLVGFEMLCKLLDPLGQKSNLDL